MMEEKTQGGSELVVDGNRRSNDNDNDKDDSLSYAYDGDNNNDNDNIRTRIDGDKISKKLRRRESNDEIPVRNRVGENSPSSPPPPPPRQWWFSRQQDASTLIGNPTSSGMVLSEHLGSTSDVVESLTHDVRNWSLTRLSSSISTTTKNGSSDCSASVLTKTKRRMEKEQRCKDAKRQVRLAQRRFLQEQKQLLSRCSPPSPCS